MSQPRAAGNGFRRAGTPSSRAVVAARYSHSIRTTSTAIPTAPAAWPSADQPDWVDVSVSPRTASSTSWNERASSTMDAAVATGQTTSRPRNHGVSRRSARSRAPAAGPGGTRAGGGRRPCQSARCSVQRVPSHQRMGAWLHGSWYQPGGVVLIDRSGARPARVLPPEAAVLALGATTADTSEWSWELLQLDGGAGLFKLGLGPVGVIFRGPLEDGLRRGIDKVLGLLETEAGELPDHLDDLDLLLTGGGKHDVELVLLLGGRGFGGPSGGGRGGDGHRRGGGDAELVLERREQFGQLEHRHLRDGVEDLVLREGCHGSVFS